MRVHKFSKFKATAFVCAAEKGLEKALYPKTPPTQKTPRAKRGAGAACQCVYCARAVCLFDFVYRERKLGCESGCGVMVVDKTPGGRRKRRKKGERALAAERERRQNCGGARRRAKNGGPGGAAKGRGARVDSSGAPPNPSRTLARHAPRGAAAGLASQRQEGFSRAAAGARAKEAAQAAKKARTGACC